MTIHCNHRKRTCKLVMNFVDVFVEIFCVHQPMDVVEGHLMEATVDAKLINKDGEARHLLHFVEHVVRREVLHQEDESSKKQRTNDILIDDEETKQLR